ncbi:LIPOPROTEIN [Mycoplasmopsis pulmonis]|uniref:LIPOPROTEIN n=1 Tax=Mycoplasmopsis pulmonis (strain UAB CTIP) TaxID=272635 RepID=Q98Q84_MYCPU|nr:hypothetical protein [Mycoplasmopsis pulmonis]CAC13655.1 LIPOPROTEIN [Mycoplasmopsis pulmonis]
MTQKEKKQKNKFKKLIKLLSLGIALPLITSFGVVACSIPTQKENQKNTDTSQSTNPSNTAETNSSGNNFTSPIKAHKQLAIDYNKSAYQLNKFLELNLDKHLKVEIENNFDISKVLAKDFNRNDQWKKLKLNTSLLQSEEVQNQLKKHNLDIKNFQFKIDVNSIQVDAYDSRKITFNIEIKAKELKDSSNRVFFSLHRLKREHTGFKEDDSNNINYSQEFEKYFETKKPSATLKSEKSDVSFTQLVKDFKSLEDDDFSKLLEKRKTFIKEYVDLVNFENEQDNVSFLINKVELDQEKLNSLKITFRLIRKTNEVIKNVITKEKEAIYASKELTLTLSKEQASSLKDEDKQKFVELNAKLRAYDYSSAYNFDFENMEDSLSKVIVDSTHEKIKYHVLDVTKNDQYTRSWKVKIISISEDPKFDKIEFVKNFEVPNRAYVFSKELQDKNTNYQMYLGYLEHKQLTEVTNSLRERMQSPIISGGWLDNRTIYLGDKFGSRQIHLGEDVLVEKKTPLLAPFDGKIVAAYYLKTNKVGVGIGTIVVMEVAKKDLVGNIDQNVIDNELAETDTINIAFIHLDDSYLKELGTVSEYSTRDLPVPVVNNITPNNPKIVKKGDVIGLIGDQSNNGGWVPHLHVEVYYGKSSGYTKEGTKIRDWSSGVHKGSKRYGQYDPTLEKFNPTNIKQIGVHFSSLKSVNEVDPITLKPIKDKNDRRNFFDDWSAYTRYGLLNPNLFFRFSDPSSLSFNIFDNFPGIEELEVD